MNAVKSVAHERSSNRSLGFETSPLRILLIELHLSGLISKTKWAELPASVHQQFDSCEAVADLETLLLRYGVLTDMDQFRRIVRTDMAHPIPEPNSSSLRSPAQALPKSQPQHLLIVDDDPLVRHMCRLALLAQGYLCTEAADGQEALRVLQQQPVDLVLLDLDLPTIKGPEVCRRLREQPTCPHLKIILMSGRSSTDQLAALALGGADDFLTKPVRLVELQARIAAALRWKEQQDNSTWHHVQLHAEVHELERHLNAREQDLVHIRGALLLSMVKLMEQRHVETGQHLQRMQRYARILAEAALTLPAFAGQLDRDAIDILEWCAPLHDLGKIAVPDRILLKPAKLDPEEMAIMQSHTVVGATMLREVAQVHGSALPCLHVAIDIARHHHERWDGSGYPDGLRGNSIPLVARLISLADVYDALRSKRAYKKAMPHSDALAVMCANTGTQFDPAATELLLKCGPRLEHTFQESSDDVATTNNRMRS